MNRDIFCSCINLNQIHIQEKCGTSVGKEKAAVYSPHLNWHSTLAVVPSIFYCDTLHPDSTRFQNPNPEVGCTAIHTLGSNLL